MIMDSGIVPFSHHSQQIRNAVKNLTVSSFFFKFEAHRVDGRIIGYVDGTISMVNSLQSELGAFRCSESLQ